VVIEKSLAVGMGGTVSTDVRMALAGQHKLGYAVIAGLGGRAITAASLERVLRSAMRDELEHLTFLDLDHAVVARQIERERLVRRSGPVAENLLRDIGSVAARIA